MGLNHRMFGFARSPAHPTRDFKNFQYPTFMPQCPNDFPWKIPFHPEYYAWSWHSSIQMHSVSHRYEVSWNRVAPKSSMLVGFSLNHPFWGTPIYGNSHVPNVFAPGVLNTLNRMSVAFRHDHLEMGCSVKLRGTIGKIGKRKPPFSYGFSYGFPMVFLWFPHGFPMVFPLKPPFSYGFPMVFLWFSH